MLSKSKVRNRVTSLETFRVRTSPNNNGRQSNQIFIHPVETVPRKWVDRKVQVWEVRRNQFLQKLTRGPVVPVLN